MKQVRVNQIWSDELLKVFKSYDKLSNIILDENLGIQECLDQKLTYLEAILLIYNKKVIAYKSGNILGVFYFNELEALSKSVNKKGGYITYHPINFADSSAYIAYIDSN